jgi:hypothetical protein
MWAVVMDDERFHHNTHVDLVNCRPANAEPAAKPPPPSFGLGGAALAAPGAQG